MDCIEIFAKEYNQNFCIHNHYVNTRTVKKETQFVHFRVNNSQSFLHLHLCDAHYTPLIQVDVMNVYNRPDNQNNENMSLISNASIPITTEINSKSMNNDQNHFVRNEKSISEKLPTQTNVLSGSNAQQNPDLKLSSENPNTILTNKCAHINRQSIKSTSNDNFFSLNTSNSWSTNSNTVQEEQSLPTDQATKTNYETNASNEHAPSENKTSTKIIETGLINRSLNTQTCITQEPKRVLHNNFLATNILFGKMPSQQNAQFVQGNESSRIPLRSLKMPTDNKNILECTNHESLSGNLHNPTSSHVDQSSLNSIMFSDNTIATNLKNYSSSSTKNVFTHEFTIGEQININHSRLGIPQCIDNAKTEHIRLSANREIEDQSNHTFVQSKTNENTITITYENLENHQRDIKSTQESQESEHHPLFRNFFTNASQNPSSFQNQESSEINAVFSPYMDMHKETYFWKNSEISNTFRKNHEATLLNTHGKAQIDVSLRTDLVLNSYTNNMHNNQEDIRNFEQFVIRPNPQYAINGMTNNEGQPLFYRTQNCPSASVVSHVLENRVSDVPFHYNNINPEIHRTESMISTDSNNTKLLKAQDLIANKPKRAYRRLRQYIKKQSAKSNEKQINMRLEKIYNESVLLTL